MSRFSKITAVLIATFIAGGTLADAPKIYGPKDSFAVVPGVTLSAHQKRHFRAFRREDAYFGAFYAAKNDDSSFYTYSYHDLDIAKAVAKRGCEAYAKGPCKFYAVALPSGANPGTTGLRGLGHITGKDFQKTYPSRQTMDGFGAFAVSGAASHGYSYNWPNKAEAKAAAIAFCEAEVAKQMTTLSIADRAWAKSKRLTTCRVIDVYEPFRN